MDKCVADHILLKYAVRSKKLKGPSSFLYVSPCYDRLMFVFFLMNVLLNMMKVNDEGMMTIKEDHKTTTNILVKGIFLI